MSNHEEEWISRRAYALWEEEGYPHGKDREHWERAKLEYATLAIQVGGDAEAEDLTAGEPLADEPVTGEEAVAVPDDAAEADDDDDDDGEEDDDKDDDEDDDDDDEDDKDDEDVAPVPVRPADPESGSSENRD